MPKAHHLAISLALFIGCSAPVQQTTPAPPPPRPTPNEPLPDKDGYIVKPSGLKYKVLRKGPGTPATLGRLVKVHYQGTLKNGFIFDSSRARNEPFRFTIGSGEVIPGWDEGVTGMRIGEKRQLIIPGKLGYGSTGIKGLIPPNATLIFEVELLGVD